MQCRWFKLCAVTSQASSQIYIPGFVNQKRWKPCSNLALVEDALFFPQSPPSKSFATIQRWGSLRYFKWLFSPPSLASFYHWHTLLPFFLFETVQLLLQNPGSSAQGDLSLNEALAQAGITRKCSPEVGGKMCLLSRMLNILYHEKKERIVLISNYTETLDIFQEMCNHSKYPFLRLDGATSVKKRQQLVDKFNDLKSHQFAFLLSR